MTKSKQVKKNKISKLDIDLMSESTEEIYNKKKVEYIADYKTYEPGGFFNSGYYKNNPIQGEAEWNKKYPKGYASWAANQQFLSGYGQQQLINKINELIDLVNKTK